MANEYFDGMTIANGTTYDVVDQGARALIASLQIALDTLMSGNTSEAINSFNEIIAFLENVSDSSTLQGIIAALNTTIAAKYTKPGTGIPATDLAQAVQSILNDVANKVDVVNGKDLSTNDYTDAEKTKLEGIAPGAQVNIINGIKAHGASTNLPVTNGVVELPEQTEVDLDDYYDKDEVDAAIANKLSNVIVNNIPAGSVAIIDDTTTGGSDKVLSAEQGKVLAEEIDDIPVIDIHMVGSTLYINTQAALSPRVNVGALSSAALSCRGGQTATATFTVSGRRLTGNIRIEVTGDTTRFSVSPSSLVPSSGEVATTQITVTYNPGSGATAGTVHNCTITITSGGVTYGTLELRGTVAAAPSITLTPASLPISTESGQSATGTINVKGNALDADITLEISGSGFSLSDDTVTKAEAESTNGKDITVTFDGSANGLTATITASSTGATSVQASVTGSVAERLSEGATIEADGFIFTVMSDRTKVSVKGTSSLPETVVVPSSVTYNGFSYEVSEVVAYGAFAGLTNVKSITFPNTLKKISGNSVFQGSSSLTSINLGTGLESFLGSLNFYGTKIVEIEIPDSLKSAGAAFRGMAYLETIKLGKTTAFSPNSVVEILKYAGNHDSENGTANSLTKVICYATTPPTLGHNNPDYENDFVPAGMQAAGTTLYVPAASISDYQAAYGWKKFPNFLTIESLQNS